MDAVANDDAVWPDGNDQVPGFLPTTSARTISMNGRLRRKNDFTGCSMTHVVTIRDGARSLSARRPLETPRSAAPATQPSQIQPPLVITVTLSARRSSKREC